MMLDIEPFKVTTLKGFPPAISHLICILSHARQVTLNSVRNLSMAELDFLLDEKANSIGALLAHIAAVEKWYQSYTFEKTEMAGNAALDLGDMARNEIKGHELQHYVDELESVRKTTIQEFQKREDAWLMEEMPFTKTSMANNFYLWFHVLEDETNHRGQINLIRKRIMKEMWRAPDIVPSITYADIPTAIEWLTRVFGFREREEARLTWPGGGMTWMEVEDSLFNISTPNDHWKKSSSETSGFVMKVYVENIDQHFARAKAEGAKIISEPEDGFWGGRIYRALDYEDHRWEISQRGRDLAAKLWRLPPGVKRG